jgi:lysophospholipase L1-like esterase
VYTDSRSRVIALISVLTGFIFWASTPLQPVSAAETPKTLSIALLGDSYSAGNGIGDYLYSDDSYRSSRNWAHLYSNWLSEQGVRARLVDESHNGWSTREILAKGVPNVAADTNLVMLTAGGNDALFSSVVADCFVISYRSPKGCKTAVDHADTRLPQVRQGIEDILQALEAKVSPESRVVLVGYPLLSSKASYVLRGCAGSPTTCTTYDAGSAVRTLGAKADSVQSEIARDWNSSHLLKVSFVSVQERFASHEPDPSPLSRNSYRWLNELAETNGRRGPFGLTISNPSSDTNVWYHPNRIGHQQIASLLASKIGVPSSVHAADSDATTPASPSGAGIG